MRLSQSAPARGLRIVTGLLSHADIKATFGHAHFAKGAVFESANRVSRTLPAALDRKGVANGRARVPDRCSGASRRSRASASTRSMTRRCAGSCCGCSRAAPARGCCGFGAAASRIAWTKAAGRNGEVRTIEAVVATRTETPDGHELALREIRAFGPGAPEPGGSIRRTAGEVTARGCFRAAWSDEARRVRILNPPKEVREQTPTLHRGRSHGGGISM